MEAIREILSDFAMSVAKWMAIILLIYGAAMFVKIATGNAINRLRQLIR